MLKETASAVSFFLPPGCRCLPSTPQSIAKPSPGWNKVALLTAVRNSPCSCPFSVSLIRPLGALNSEPRSGSLLVLPPTKSCPRLWGKWHEVPKGVRLKTAECRELFPPQLRLRSAERWLEYGRLAALPLAILPIPPDSPLAASPTGRARLESPVSRWRLLVQYKLGVQCRTPSRSDRFNGVTGGAGGPKGRNRNLPWPPCKKGYKETPFSFVYLNPSVTAYAVPAPRRGEPFGALYTPCTISAGRQ